MPQLIWRIDVAPVVAAVGSAAVVASDCFYADDDGASAVDTVLCIDVVYLEYLRNLVKR